ncbi:MAG: helix-turn-helix transcriptional regulator [Treponema sp.]|nr:helix-turn-helix transcriptional regulator [Treponema sp.]
MSHQSTFIANLKHYRSLKGFSQAKLAELCNCQPGTIGCIESGRQYPSFDLMFKIADVLQVHPADLFLRNASNVMEETYLILKEELLPQLEQFVDKRFGSTSLK